MSAGLFTVTRRNVQTGATWTPSSGVVNTRGARQLVAFCATDNCGMNRRVASALADALPLDATPYRVGDYEFTVTPA